MINQKTHNSTPAMYNNSHIYFNYRQIPFTLFFFFINFMFYPFCHTYIYISRVHTRKLMGVGVYVGGGLLNKVVQDKKEECLEFLMWHMSNTAHHKHDSVVVLYLKVHTVYSISDSFI